MAKLRERIVTPVGKTAWCHVIVPREDLSHQMAWDVAIEVDESFLEKVAATGDRLLEDARSADPKFPKGDDKLIMPWVPSRGPKKDDGTPGDIIEGKYLLKAKRRCLRMRNGAQEKNPAPIIQDRLGEPIRPGTLDDIPPNSRVRLMLDLFPYNKAGNAGLSFGLVGVQVVELGQTDSFDPVEDEDGDIAY